MDINDDHLKKTTAPDAEVIRVLRELANMLENIEKAGYPSGWDVFNQPHILFHDHENGKHRIARASVSVCKAMTT